MVSYQQKGKIPSGSQRYSYWTRTPLEHLLGQSWGATLDSGWNWGQMLKAQPIQASFSLMGKHKAPALPLLAL